MPNFPSKFQLINKINDRITGFQQLIERVLEISLSDRSIQNNILKIFFIFLTKKSNNEVMFKNNNNYNSFKYIF